MQLKYFRSGEITLRFHRQVFENYNFIYGQFDSLKGNQIKRNYIQVYKIYDICLAEKCIRLFSPSLDQYGTHSSISVVKKRNLHGRNHLEMSEIVEFHFL